MIDPTGENTAVDPQLLDRLEAWRKEEASLPLDRLAEIADALLATTRKGIAQEAEKEIVLPDGRVYEWVCDGHDLKTRSGEEDLWLRTREGKWIPVSYECGYFQTKYELDAFVFGASEFGAAGYKEKRAVADSKETETHA